MEPHQFSDPSKEEISLVVYDVDGSEFTITRFVDYVFHQSMLTPVSGFSFTLAGDRLDDMYGRAVVPGAKVRLMCGGSPLTTGFIDSVERRSTRSGGWVWRIEGRDSLGQPADIHADPKMAVKESMTLLEALKVIFAPFGWGTDDSFVDTNDTDVELRAGQKFRTKSKKSEQKGFGRRRVKDYQIHQYRPYPQESTLDFALRITQRFGLWLWSTCTGDKLVVAPPLFDQPSLYYLYNTAQGSNVLDGSVKQDLADQPTHIVADSYSSGGEFGRGKVTVILKNSAVQWDEGRLPPELESYVKAGARILTPAPLPEGSAMRAPRPRVLFFHDDESHSSENIEAYVRQKMGELARRSLQVSYQTEGHGQVINDVFVPWFFDALVTVNDDYNRVHEDLYVASVTFSKSRSGGTRTDLGLIRRNTLVFSDIGK